MKALTAALVVLWTCLAATGCAQERGPYSPITPDDATAPHQTTHGVTMLDEDVRNALLLRGNTATRTPMGQIQARVTLQNAYREDVWADARFVFFNPQDEPVEVGQWRTYHFGPQDLVLVEGNSIRAGLVKYNVQFRDLKTASGVKITYPGRVYEEGRWKQSVLPK
jgi:predicted small lipoprotein YifL